MSCLFLDKQLTFITGGVGIMNKLALPEDMTREQWLNLRRRGIGGSDASVVLGVNPYRSVLELWLDKTKQLEPEESTTEAAYWGQVLEPVVREEFTKRSGLSVTRVPFLLQHDKYRFMLANLDGMIDDPVYGKCVFEAKTSSAYKAEEWETGIPVSYYAQVQHYLAVTGWQGAYIAALIGGNDFIYRFITRDEGYIAMLIEEEQRFWDYVRRKEMPPADGSKATTEFLKHQYAKSREDSTIILEASNLKWLEQYQQAISEEKLAKEKKQEAENTLKLLMGKHEIAYLDGNEIRWINISKQQLDQKLLKIDAPEIYQQYLKESSSRRFSVKCS